jgi:hypothetical protein
MVGDAAQASTCGHVVRGQGLSDACREQWLAEINKMRGAYGAPIPANQIDALANMTPKSLILLCALLLMPVADSAYGEVSDPAAIQVQALTACRSLGSDCR